MRSAFGIEHTITKGIRPDRTVDAAIVAAKRAKAIKPKPVQTPLADTRFGPRIQKSVFSIDSSIAKDSSTARRHQALGAAAGGAATYRAHQAITPRLIRRSERRAQAATGLHRLAVPDHAHRAAGRLVRARSGPVVGAVIAGGALAGAAAVKAGHRSVAKSAFGIVHKGPLAAVDDVALAPGKVKAVTGTVRSGVAVPAPASSPRKPLAQKLNAAVAATGGSQT